MSDPRPSTAEQVLQGLGVSPGIAIGLAHRHDVGSLAVPEYKIPKDRLAAECARFTEAVAQSSRQIAALQEKTREMARSSGEELDYLLEAYRHMLNGSRLVRGVERRIATGRINAEAALRREIDEIVQGFQAMDDAYLAARVEDIREVGRRLIRNLGNIETAPFAKLPKKAVILAEELSPADTAQLDPAKVAGFATLLGGAASHTAIMARSLGLPAVVGVAGLLPGIGAGRSIIIDGTEGRVILDPAPATLARYRQRRADHLRGRRKLHRLAKVPAVTLDGSAISLSANLELPGEIEQVLAAGADGVGLLRSEFLYMNRPDLPSEEEQYLVFRTLVQRLDGRPLTIRTLDLGADKAAPALGGFEGPNPALGLRAIRLSLKRPDLLATQLKAALRAGAHGPVRILLPMVATTGQIVQVREAMSEAARSLRKRKLAHAQPLPPLGAMIEIPGAALSADALAWHSDFFAIGTNDLTQYTLAIDRSDEQVSHLYDPLHPAVLRLIQFATEAALRARIPVSVCGEIAGDPRFTALLLGLGIRDLSMAASSIPAVKQRVRSIEMVAAIRRARSVMDQSDPVRIAQMLDDFNQVKG